MNKTLKTIIWLVVIILIIWGIYALSSKKQVSREPIKIGAILPLTGDLSFLGEEVKSGILLAIEDINKNNDRKINIIFEDSKMDPKEGINAVNKLKNINKINNLIVWGTSVISAVQPITEEGKIVLIGGSVSPSILKDKEYTFRIFYNLSQVIEKFIYFIKENNFSNIAAFYQNNEATEQQIKGLENNGINFAIKEKFNIGEKDFKTTLLKIKDKKTDLIILLGYGAHFPAIFKQIKELGLEDIPVLGGLDFLEIPDSNLSLYEQAIFVVPEFNVNPSNKSSDFIIRFEEEFKMRPTHQAAYAYDIINIIYDAIIKSRGDINREMRNLKSLDNYRGVVGEIKIFSNGDSQGSLSFARYENSKIIPYLFHSNKQ